MPDTIHKKAITRGQVQHLLAGGAVAFPVEAGGKTVGVLLTVEGTEPVPTNDTTAAGAAEGDGDE